QFHSPVDRLLGQQARGLGGQRAAEQREDASLAGGQPLSDAGQPPAGDRPGGGPQGLAAPPGEGQGGPPPEPAARIRPGQLPQPLDARSPSPGRSSCTTARWRPEPTDSSIRPSRTIHTPGVGSPPLNRTEPGRNGRISRVEASAVRSSGRSGAA